MVGGLLGAGCGAEAESGQNRPMPLDLCFDMFGVSYLRRHFVELMVVVYSVPGKL